MSPGTRREDAELRPICLFAKRSQFMVNRFHLSSLACKFRATIASGAAMRFAEDDCSAN